jgi:MFS family permease
VSGNVRKLELFRALFWMHFVAAVLTPFFTLWGRLTLTEMLTLNAWFMAWNFAMEIPTGAIADYVGRKWSLVLGSVVASSACVFYVSAPRLEVFLVGEIVFALGYALVSGADEALLYESLAAEGRAGEVSDGIARLQAAQLVGIVTGGLAGSLIASRWGLPATMLCQAAPMALSGVVAATLVEPVTSAARAQGVPYRALLLTGFRRLAGDGALRIVVLDAVAVGAFAWTLIWLQQAVLARAGVPQLWFGAVHAGICTAQIAVLRAIAPLTSLAGGRAAYLHAVALVAGLAMLALGAVLPPVATITLVVLAMAVGLTRMPIVSSVLAARADAHARATLLSTVSMLRTLAICVVNPIAGWLADRSLGTAMLALGLATVGVAVLSPLRERHLDG